MGLLILQRKDSGTRNDFLGGTSGPYIWGKEKCTPGSLGRQGNPLRVGRALVPCGAWIEFFCLVARLNRVLKNSLAKIAGSRRDGFSVRSACHFGFALAHVRVCSVAGSRFHMPSGSNRLMRTRL
jgi:hypothetical protein